MCNWKLLDYGEKMKVEDTWAVFKLPPRITSAVIMESTLEVLYFSSKSIIS